MRIFLIALFISGAFFTLQAQQDSTQRALTPEEIAAQKQFQQMGMAFTQLAVSKYQIAKRYNDRNNIKSAIYELIAINPNNVNLLDTLALMYFEERNYISAALVTKDVLQVLPEDKMALEISALSYENLGVLDQAVTRYETLYLKNNDPVTLYKIAGLNLDLKRYSEFDSNVSAILENQSFKDTKLEINNGNGGTQQVTMETAVRYLQGVRYEEIGDKNQAKEFYNKALALDPQFTAAKAALDKLK
ncbi:tetratricopeptide repeat protein [Marinigracilibium pacificum]|uniref:Tetratricopeptide repeat protein n=1 Tax=Marinigracilibium pacificum TaxID=2729599 RepID=A0A848J4G0_9BACT|nr:hypothetical protein [Marinigracilibium pacificum]NMM50606.1 hypothetical protein [Marinigracilibium pacificum]